MLGKKQGIEGTSEESLGEASVLAVEKGLSKDEAVKQLLENTLLGLGVWLSDMQPGSTVDKSDITPKK